MKAKLINLLMIFYFPIILNAQLNGAYAKGYLYSSTSIKLLPNKTYRYRYRDCTSHYEMYGAYKKKWGKLILYCQSDSLNQLNAKDIKTTTLTSDSDTILIDLFVYDSKTNKPIVAAYPYITNSVDYDVSGKPTDNNGNSQFRVPKLIDSVFIGFECIGYGIYYYQVPTNNDTKIEVYLNTSLKVDESKSISYDMFSFNKNAIYLKREGGKKFVKYNKYEEFGQKLLADKTDLKRKRKIYGMKSH